eukprot:10228048-Karenia_brevis.AAC.1
MPLCFGKRSKGQKMHLRTAGDHLLTSSGHQLPIVKQYKLLGTVCDANGTMHREVRARRCAASSALRPLYKSVLKHCDVSSMPRKVFVQSLVCSTLCHNVHSWAGITQEDNKLMSS